jgi:hypothetical protein
VIILEEGVPKGEGGERGEGKEEESKDGTRRERLTRERVAGEGCGWGSAREG